MDEYENQNIYQADSETKVVEPHSKSAINVRCPHCLSIGTFQTHTRGVSYAKLFKYSQGRRGNEVFAFIRICPNQECRGLIFTLSIGKDINVIHPPEILEFNPVNLPEGLVATLKEAISCHSIGAFRASAMMVRRLLEELCDHAGVSGKTLHDRLKSLRTQITLPEELFDAMDELKALGNDAAHIEAKSYQVIDKEEAELSIELAQEILKARFQHKHLVDRLRSRRKSAN